MVDDIDGLFLGVGGASCSDGFLELVGSEPVEQGGFLPRDRSKRDSGEADREADRAVCLYRCVANVARSHFSGSA